MARKVYVEVIARFDTDGNITPLSVKWEDGTVYEIDKVIDKINIPRRSREYFICGQSPLLLAAP